eukprot:jgi/Picre1/30068/NNA_005439.t1
MSGTKDTFVVDISQEMNVLESKEWEDVDVIMLRKRRKPHAVHIDVDMAKQDEEDGGASGAACVKEEMEFTRGCLEFDAKNYHVWAHRQAVLKMWPTEDSLRVSQDQLDGFLECSASLMTRHETSIQPAIAVYEFYKVMLEHAESSSDEKTYSRAKVMMETLSHKLRLLDPLGAHRYSI